MFNRFFIVLTLALFTGADALANNPFAKSEVFIIGKDAGWSLDRVAGTATKTKADKNGGYYHLRFDNKQIELLVSQDEEGNKPRIYNQLDIKDVRIDGKQSALFRWCLNNQESHDRFLQQGLSVKSDVCVSDGSRGSFIMHLDSTTLDTLKAAKEVTIILKPFRTPLELRYDFTDFDEMTVALNARDDSADPSLVTASVPAVAIPNVKQVCFSSPPVEYSSIQPVEYECDDLAAKSKADGIIENLVRHQQELAEKQKRLAEEKRQKEIAAAEAERLKLEEQKRAEEAAIAASQANQQAINNEIVAKMVAVCDKFWSKGEHRCYCQKYIDHAPGDIQANSSCQ